MITKEQVESLFNGKVIKNEYDKIIHQIDKRFDEICKKFLSIKKSYGWYDYDNICHYEFNSNGYFDPERYREYISITGEWIKPPDGFDLNFPTRWLWEENWEREMQKTIEEYKKQTIVKKHQIKNRQETKKQKKELLITNIKSKLTKEELKIVKFK